MGISGTRWTVTRKVILRRRYSLYSGLAGDDASHEKSVALILSKDARKSLKEWEAISERVITARF